MDAEVLRGIERLVVVLVGGLSVYLGYRLFLSLPEQKDSEGRLNLPGDISIYFSRVGPGIFFALFGSLIVTASLYFSVTIFKLGEDDPMIFSGFVPQTQLSPDQTAPDQTAIDEANLKGHLTLVNAVETHLAANTTSEYRADWKRTLPWIKLALLKSGWQPGWGNYAQFESIILEGDFGRLASQSQYQTPFDLYQSGAK